MAAPSRRFNDGIATKTEHGARAYRCFNANSTQLELTIADNVVAGRAWWCAFCMKYRLHGCNQFVFLLQVNFAALLTAIKERDFSYINYATAELLHTCKNFDNQIWHLTRSTL